MSYDVNIEMDTGGDVPAQVEDVRNVTYNNADLFRALKVHRDDIHPQCLMWISPLSVAILELEMNREKYIHLEPENKWGGIDDSLDFMRKLLSACKRHPRANVRWS